MATTGTNIEVRTGNITVRYDDLGTGTTPIIFLHGFPFNKSMWKPQMEKLKDKHRVIAYDIRGFGKTSAGQEKPSITLFADDLIRFMDTLQINKAIVCGLSMGGYIVLNAVSRYHERFEAILLCDTQCIADSLEVKEKRYRTIEQIEQNGIREYAENFVNGIFHEESFSTKMLEVEKIKDIILATPLETITKTLQALAERQETCFSLPEIKVPTLIICGRQDIVTPVKQSEYMYEHIVNSTLHTIDKAAHMSNLEQPDEFNNHLYNFVSVLQPDKILVL